MRSIRLVRLAIVLAAAAALPLRAQSPPAGDAPSGPSEPDYWYRIMIQGRHVGSAHFTLNKLTSEGGKLLRRLVHDYSFTDNERGHLASARIEADLDPATLAVQRYLYSGEETLPTGRRELSVKCDPTGPGKWNVQHQSATGTFAFELASSDPVFVEESVALLLARKSAQIAGGGTIPVKLLNPFQTDQMTLDVEVDVRRPEPRTVLGKEAQIVLYSWRRRHPAPENEVSITEYMAGQGEIVESTRLYVGSKLGVTAIRVATEDEASPAGRRMVKRRGRRDPFDKGKVMTLIGSTQKGGAQGTSGVPGQKPGAGLSPADILKMLSDARRLVEDSEILVKNQGKEIPKVKVERNYNDFINILLAFQAVPDLPDTQRNDLAGLRVRFEKLVPGGKGIYEQGKKMLARSRILIEERDDAGALRIVEEIKGLEARPEIVGTEFMMPFRNEILAEARKIEESVRVRQEFSKIKLEITGIVYNLVDTPFPVDLGVRLLGQDLRVSSRVNLPVSKSGAIINGFAVEEGDVLNKKGELDRDIKPEDGMQVVRIFTDEVVFRYRGEDVSVPLR